MRPIGVRDEPAGGAEPTRGAGGSACLHLWARVVLQVLWDIDAGLRVLGTGATARSGAADGQSARLGDARSAAAWLFDPAARRDRAWVCGWLDIEPGRLQEAVRLTHGNALDDLLTK